MNFGPIRQVFQPLFGLERRQTLSRFLKTILFSVIVVDTSVILFRSWDAKTLTSPTLLVLTSLLGLQFVLLFMLRRGYVDSAAVILVTASWFLFAYQAWSANGLRDAAIFVFVLIILAAALLTNWTISIALSILSIAFIWVMAITESMGLRIPQFDDPLLVAGDFTAVFILLILLVYLVVNNVRHSLEAVRIGE